MGLSIRKVYDIFAFDVNAGKSDAVTIFDNLEFADVVEVDLDNLDKMDIGGDALLVCWIGSWKLGLRMT